MKKFLVQFGLLLLSLILKLRYRVTYKGLDAIEQTLSKDKGALFLPNHPSLIVDPSLVSIPLIRRFQIRPLIVEYMYFQPFFHWAMRTIKAISIPNFSTGFNPIKLKRSERTLKTISDALKEQGRFLIYPAGTTKHQAKEVLGGAFGVHQLLSENPDVQVVLVRTTGLWGSSFSRALTSGNAPETRAALKAGFWTVLKNLIFFVPKRKVLIEFELAGEGFPRKATKQELNRYLEEWYNRPFGAAGEPLTLVSFAFWKKELPKIKEIAPIRADLSQVPLEVQKKVASKVSELAKVPVSNVLADLKLIEDLGLDSLDAAELIAFIEEQYGVSGITPQDVATVGLLYIAAAGLLKKKELPDLHFKMKAWDKDYPQERLNLAHGQTIPEAFLNACDNHLFDVIATDPLLGPTSYYKIKRSALILSEKIAALSGSRIGILLPSSIMAVTLILACQMAGKTPVMINWTVGGRHLDTVVDVAKIEVVLSSWKFLDFLDNVDISRIEPMLLVLEELKVQVSLKDIIKGSYLALKRASKLLQRTAPLQRDDEAVILFTSGTESMPKGVPLTHANILSNLEASLKTVALYRSDRLLSFLPPFHSFGFTITGLLPLLCGLRVVYFPNPTDSKRLAKGIESWNVNVLCSAPTFLKNIFLASTKKQLRNIRLAISGAEKASEELLALFHKLCPKALFAEGYGITECSPVLSANVSGDPKYGVGLALDGIRLKIVDPENLTIAKKSGEVGLILASGPNIFSGYLNKLAFDPFIQLEGVTWYQTGDLGSLDEQGNLRIMGRLKRFVKIGGEMISLAALEEALSNHTGEKISYVVMHEDDPVGKPRLVLFTTEDSDVMSVNQLLRKSGFSNLAKIDRIVHLAVIPQTATGKVAFRQLEKLLQEGKPA